MGDQVDQKYGQYEVPKRPVKLNVGQPGPAMLPLSLLNSGLDYLKSLTDPRVMQYGDIPGYLGFRKVLASFLQAEYSKEVTPEELFVCQGVTGALSFYCSLFAPTGSTVFVEEPTYFLAINIFKNDFKLNCVSVPITPTGLDLDALEKSLQADTSGKPRFLYTIPSFHNPTSYTLSHEKRVALAALAEKYNFRILADEVYQMLYFGETAPPPPMVYYTNKAISIGSFSKILMPALRLGWIQIRDPEVMDAFLKCGQMDSSGGVSPITQALVHGIIDSNALKENISFNQKTLKVNCNDLATEVRKQLDKYVEFIEPTGGYFLWLKIKGEFKASELLAIVQDVTFTAGLRFSAHGACDDYLRLSFSYYSPEDFAHACGQIKKAFEAKEQQ